MILVESFFSGTLNTVDAVIANFVSNAYSHFVQANTGVITLLFTVYVMFLGYQFLYQPHHFNVGTVMRQLIVLLSVYGLVMNWRLYHLFVYNIFTNEPANIAKILMNSSGAFQGETNISQAMDGIYLTVIGAASRLFGQANFSVAGLAFIFYAFLVYIIGTLMCVFALLLFIYAKMMMAIVLALGPIFILFILWEPTKGMFGAWLSQLITTALIPVVTSAILALMLSVINVTLPNMNVSINDMQFYGIVPFLGLSLAVSMILSQIFHICSALGGGLRLASLSTGGAIANHALQKSGIAAASRGAMNWTQNRARQIKNKMKGGKS